MNKKELIQKITAKKELSRLPKRDVEAAFKRFDKKPYGDFEKIKMTRELLHKMYGAFISHKLLKLKDKSEEWILRKHLSTRERLPHYKELYSRILKEYRVVSIIDLGSGVNGFSYNYFKKLDVEVNYIGVEAIGQLVDLMNFYFKKEKLKGKALHLSLFDLEKIKNLIKETEKPKIIFLFKILDSLEVLKRDYSKKLILEISPFADKIVVSFATESMMKRKKFKIKRTWILKFIEENFRILDDFELSGERYIIFNKK
jgi:hypothetical protein